MEPRTTRPISKSADTEFSSRLLFHDIENRWTVAYAETNLRKSIKQ